MNKNKTMRFTTVLCTMAMLAGGVVYAATPETAAPASENQPMVTAEEPAFTSMIRTSYDDINTEPVDYIQVNTLIDKSDISFMVIADKAIEAANQNCIPSGWPVESRIVSTEFNPTGNPSISDGRKHEGMDISTRSQIIPIYATAEGKVVTANYHRDYGYQVIIDHTNGYKTLYAHCDELLVNAGDIVKKGDTIATTGNTGMSTGIHCHYEIMLNGIYQNPRDYLGE